MEVLSRVSKERTKLAQEGRLQVEEAEDRAGPSCSRELSPCLSGECRYGRNSLQGALGTAVSDARVRRAQMRERAHREASSVLLVPLGYVVSDGGQACPLCHLGPPNPEGSLRLTGCLSVPTGHWVPWLIAPLCLKTPPPSQPSHLRDGGGKWPPDSRYPRAEWHQLNLQRLGEVPGLEARCQGLGHRSMSVHASYPRSPPLPPAARTF